ncbi:lectin [Actinoallomurus rhizosphaericola]|uniref:lectin n=1 Tax=Actinoallomurus rhizosphaericola TaxID=2952536 RepID=UPI00209205D7|nr:lectin [Actinoallomurus rhizosphaericola]MCO5995508.1 lectin [Actinoallomurus rhizosphaericola]
MALPRPLRALTPALLLLGALFLPAPASASAAALVSDPASLVNPLLGTTNGGNDFPGADVPFGMLQWSPDTSSRALGGGYSYNSSTITGFSLTHMAGPGCGAYGDVPIMPTTGAVSSPGSASSPYSHANESASPGYYGVTLGNGVKTELTTTTRGGIGRFTFPSTTQANLLFKLTGSQNPVSATTWQTVGNTEVVGSVTSGRFCDAANTYTLHFSVAFDHPFSTGTWLASGVQAGARRLAQKSTARTTGTTVSPHAADRPDHPRLHGTAASTAAPLAAPNGGYLTFDTTTNQVVTARIGISFTSDANATANRDAEVPNFGFDATRTAAHNAWNSMLGKIQTAGGTTAQQHVFYTSLYHALLHPNVFSDANGQYMGFDNAVHTAASGHAQYANYSGWDIYRSQAQLIGMIAPAQASDVAQSAVNDYAQGGRLPKWAQANGESYVMVGDPAAPIIADIYAFGGRDFDTAAAKNAMIHQATVTNNDRPGLNYLSSIGYLPSDGSYGCCNYYGSVSTTLEYDTADFAVGTFAGALGDTANQKKFVDRAQNWKNLLNTSSGFMQPRTSSGSWAGGFSPTSGTEMVEGTSWQYTGMVPFNVRGLADAKGGNAGMVSYLDHVLAAYDGSGGDHADLGNEPSIELPWEYDYVGRPWRTQEVIRNVQNKLWPDSPTGWGVGNDDLGTMSAWYVWSAMGMFPDTPGTSDLALGSPLFTQVVITLSTGNKLTVNAPQAATDAPYVQSATWNGGDWNNAYLPASAVTAGGTLALTLGTTANTSWATAASSAPPSYAGSGGTTTRTGPITSGIAGKCVDVANSSGANGAHVQLYTCNNTNAQKWTVQGDGTLTAFGKCMDVNNSGTADGTKVQLYDCNSTGAQQWTYDTANKALVNPESGKCLDDPNSTTTDGTQLQIYTCNKTAAQQWTLPG